MISHLLYQCSMVGCSVRGALGGSAPNMPFRGGMQSHVSYHTRLLMLMELRIDQSTQVATCLCQLITTIVTVPLTMMSSLRFQFCCIHPWP